METVRDVALQKVHVRGSVPLKEMVELQSLVPLFDFLVMKRAVLLHCVCLAMMAKTTLPIDHGLKPL